MTNIMDECFSRDESIVSREIAGEMILVPIRSKIGDVDSIFTLNEVGAKVWELIDGKTATRKIMDNISKEFEVDSEKLEKDIHNFIDQLKEINAIE